MTKERAKEMRIKSYLKEIQEQAEQLIIWCSKCDYPEEDIAKIHQKLQELNFDYHKYRKIEK